MTYSILIYLLQCNLSPIQVKYKDHNQLFEKNNVGLQDTMDHLIHIYYVGIDVTHIMWGQK